MSIKLKMTAIADKIRSILGTKELMGLDSIAINLDECQDVVNTQSDLLDLAIETISSKAAGSTPADPILQSKTARPTEESQNILADSGYDGLSSVLVEGIDKTYVGSNITKIKEQYLVPGVNDQVITAGQYLEGDQTIAGDNNLVAENIKYGVNIFGIEGAYDGIDTSDATATEEDIINGKTAYVNGELIVGSLTEMIDDVTMPKTAHSFWNDNSGNYFELSSEPGMRMAFEENAVLSIYMPSSELGNALAGDVALGKTFTSSSGVSLVGTKIDPEGLPSDISKIAAGTFKLNSNTNTNSIAHGLGVVPNFIIVIAKGTVSDSSFANYVIQLTECYKPIGVFGNSYAPDVSINLLYGNGDGGVSTTWAGYGRVSSVFNESTVSIEMPSDVNFKSGTTYFWICGLANF